MRSVFNKNKIFEIREDIKLGDKAYDGGQLRPHIVWFEEDVPMLEAAVSIIEAADIFVVIGTSLQVYPAASLINFAQKEIPKFIIDKKVPNTFGIKNITAIESSATEGIFELKEILKKKILSLI